MDPLQLVATGFFIATLIVTFLVFLVLFVFVLVLAVGGIVVAIFDIAGCLSNFFRKK